MSFASPLARALDLRGDLRLDVVRAPALQGNSLGDPADRTLPVYLPPGYDPDGSRRYPTFYVLHAYGGNAASAVAARPWETNVVQWIDRLIVQKKMPPALLAVVDGWTRLGGAQYVDSVHNGRYATYAARDVVAHLDTRYRTIACEGGRAVLGRSSGGFGAIHLATTHPGVFCAFASHSGDAYFRLSLVAAFAMAHRTLEAYGGEAERFVEAFEQKQKRSQAEFETMMILAQAAAYSPLAARPFAFDLPFDATTGELRDDVLDRWLSFDPVEACMSKHAELARLRLRFLDAGRRDDYGLDVGARILAGRLRGMDLDVTHQEFEDDHRNIGYRYAVSLPALAAVMDAE